MKIWILTFALVTLGGANAFARRMYVQCDEGKNKKGQYSAHANYNPDIAQETMWKKQGRSSTIVTYKPGKVDEGESTTARVTIGLPGKISIAEFYTVNVFGTQGYDELGPYRTFHGFDKNHNFDFILYLSDAGLRESPSSFKGLLTFQPDDVDQGYYHVNLVCSARARD